MGKSNKPHWDESETGYEEDVHQEEDQWQEKMEDEWIEAEMIEQETSQHYFNDAHEALSKLTQKSNKRAQYQQKRPRRAETWS